MKYIALLYQKGGCDYTIGCGRRWVDFEADSLRQLGDKVREIASEHDVDDLFSMRVIGIGDTDFEADLDKIRMELEQEMHDAEEAEAKEDRRAQYEALKAEVEGG